jgi:outer membrane protein assembly factor BamB
MDQRAPNAPGDPAEVIATGRTAQSGGATLPRQTAPRTWRRWILPVVCLVLSAVALALPGLWRWSDLDQTPQSGLVLTGMVVAPLCWLIVVIWFFASGLARAVKLATGIVLLVFAGAAVAAVRHVDVDGNLRPILRFRWEPLPEDLLDRHREGTRANAALPPIDLEDSIGDFPRYRMGNGIVIPLEFLSTDWSENAPRLLWRQPCGGGYAGFAVAGNVAVTIEQRRQDESIVCYDRATGRERWVYSYPARFRDFTGDGPRATPTIHKGRVYSFGATGELVCLDGATGKKLWQRNAVADSKARVVIWGMSSSPLIVDDLGLVIVNPGIDSSNNAGMALAAYRLDDGEPAWATGDHAAGYSSPQLVTLAGRRQVLLFDADGLGGHDPRSGKELWRHAWKTSLDMNIIQPLVLGGNRIFVSSEASNGCAMLGVSRQGGEFRTDVLWTNRSLASKFANPIALDGAIYGLSLGTLVCLDQQTGKRRWRGRYYGHGQLLAVSKDAVLVMSEPGYVALVAANVKEFHELTRLDVFGDKTWNTPAVAGQQLFIRNDREMACFELPLRD